MPRQLLVINRFERGENLSSHASDLTEGEHAECINTYTDIVGELATGSSISTAGTNHPSTHTDQGSTCIKGRGLYAFGTEMSGFHTEDQVLAACAWNTTYANITCTASALIFIGCKVYHPVYFQTGTYVIAIITGDVGSNVTEFTTADSPDAAGTVTGKSLTIGNLDTSTHYIASVDTATSQVDVIDLTTATGTVHTNVIDFGTADAATQLPHMSYENGAFIVTDGNFLNTQTNKSTSKWRGYVENVWFAGSVNGWVANGWRTEDAEIHSPLKYAASGLSSLFKTNLTSALSGIDTTLGKVYVSFFEEASSITNTLWEGTWNIAVSYIYDNDQESLLHYLSFDGTAGTGVAIGNDKKVTVQCAIGIGTSAHTEAVIFNKRILGVKVYAKKQGSVGFGTRNWYLVANLPMDYGGRDTHEDTQGALWGLQATNGSNVAMICDAGDMEDPILVTTYESETGHLAESPTTGKPFTTLHAVYKTKVVANRIAYIGNVFSDGKAHPDRMLKSPVNQTTKFPVHRYLDVVTEDGEEITALSTFNDKLLQFKDQTLYILNVAEDVEYLEGSYKGMGVWGQSAVTTTDYGIFWVNKWGAFYYDSKQITNLLEMEGISKHKYATWNVAMTNPQCTFNPVTKQIVIMSDSYSAPVFYIYNITTQAWSRGSSTNYAITVNQIKSNIIEHPVVDSNPRSIVACQGQFHYITFTPYQASAGFQWTSKMLVFGNMALRKKIKKIYISHSGAGTDKVYLWLRAKTTADTDWTPWTIVAGSFGNYTVNAGGHAIQTWSAFTIDLKNVYAMQVRVSDHNGSSAQTAPATFKLGDISISFKAKTVK